LGFRIGDGKEEGLHEPGVLVAKEPSKSGAASMSPNGSTMVDSIVTRDNPFEAVHVACPDKKYGGTSSAGRTTASSRQTDS
jgi:hypothetical protein